MINSIFLKGWFIGLSIAMPVGPIGLLCVRNSLAYGMICGLVCGLGVACADAICGALAGLGISSICEFLENYRTPLQIFGSFFLCYLGLSTFFAKPDKNLAIQTQATYFRIFFSTFILTLTNPLTILSFVGIYAALGIGNENLDLISTLLITIGVFIGSSVWWLILSFFTSFLKNKVSENGTLWLNRISGSAIFGFGIFGLITLFFA